MYVTTYSNMKLVSVLIVTYNDTSAMKFSFHFKTVEFWGYGLCSGRSINTYH
jgi:hypothetical protein